MSDIIAIALNKLDADPKNVRKTYTKESIESLSASILANGVIQNLVVRKASKGRYLVSVAVENRAYLVPRRDYGESGRGGQGPEIIAKVLMGEMSAGCGVRSPEGD
ncbi:ParB/RepB/Spo0J family partition protein [Rhizobium sp. SL86]|uniref:ParB/RepB/Spo0J family partition protein n=1 Tax=Rhizobium sp. SL86 TaxID=2995148 RepID=UPI0022741784|nr:ParB N-terminal domain-containing protein [Rhizobium sp. SL86]MCY1667643.1 ParB N-terminal domain-containing protein [Rhizobium sp. SL86]